MKSFIAPMLISATLLAACNKGGNNDDNPGGGGGGGGNNNAPTVSSTSPDYVFWGKELTINGTGFSTNANENIVYIKGNKSCDPDTTWQKAEVVSASSTKLVVKVPFVKRPNGTYCGNDYGRVRVTVGGKSVTREEAVKFLGPLEISLCHPYGVTIGNFPNTYRPGDTSVMTAHFYTPYGKESGYYDKIRLHAEGTNITWKERYWPGGTCGGLAFMPDALTFSQLTNCIEPENYGGGIARKITFTATVDGTDIKDTTEVYMFNQPKMEITSKEGPEEISLTGGGNTTVKLKGKHFHFEKIRWMSNKPAFHTSPPPHNVNTTEMDIYIPLSLMVENETYTAVGITHCGKESILFSVAIKP